MHQDAADRARGTPLRPFLAAFVPLAFLLACAAWYAGQAAVRNAIEPLQQRDREHVLLAAARLRDLIATPTDHVRSLAREADVVAGYLAGDVAARAPMEQAFVTLLSRNPRYRSARWIDASGVERAKVARAEGAIAVVPDSGLEDRGDRYYVREALASPPGTVYLSAMDLSMSRGRVVEPYVPLLRVLQQVFDERGNSRGLICIDVQVEDLVTPFLSSAAPVAHRLALLDAGGYWIHSPDAEDEWGTVIGDRPRFSERAPTAWARVTAADSGQARLSEGLWTWSAMGGVAGFSDVQVERARWVAIALLPEAELRAAGRAVLLPVVGVAVALVLLCGAGIWLLVGLLAQRERAREARRALLSQQMFKAVFDASANGLLVVDEHHGVVMANRELERIFGYDAGELNGVSMAVLVPEGSRERHAVLTAEYVRNPGSRRMGGNRELSGCRKDGSPVAVEVALSHFTDLDRSYSVANVLDSSRRRRAEQIEAERRRTLEAIAEGRPLPEVLDAMARGIESLLPGALCSVLLVEGEPKRLRVCAAPNLPDFYNDAVDGIVAGEGVGACGTAAFRGRRVITQDILEDPNWKDFRELAHRAGLRSCWSEPVLDPAQTVLGTFAIYHRTARAPEAEHLALMTQAATLASIAIGRNNAELALSRYREHLEELVEQRSLTITQLNGQLEKRAHEAEQGSIAKSRFLANMSHEIRTPMNAIIGFSRLLRGRIADPAQLEWLDKTIAAGNHLLRIIDDILDYTKIEAGQMQLEAHVFRIGALVAQVRSMVTETARSKGVELLEDLPAEVAAATVRGDSLRLRQVLLNLMGNAVKFTSEGNVALRIRLEPLGDREVLLRAEIQDTGIGVREEYQPILFKPFEQGEASTTRRFGGTGLGLAICARLVALMGGEIGVNSSPGTGSTFWFTARLSLADAGDTVQDAEPRQPRVPAFDAGARVLVVEDNAINQEVAREILRDLGMEAELAENGAVALERIRTGAHYDLVLMDMQMPVMDGLEATRRIRALPDGERIPVIALTANAFDEDRERCEAAGMNGFLAKPVDVEQLRGLLERYLGPAKLRAEGPATGPQTAGVIDVAAGMRRVGGQRTLYEQLLRRFVQEHGSDGSVIGQLVRAGDRDAARHKAHALKGAAATLGIDDVQRVAAALERQLREGHPAPGVEGVAGELAAALDAAAGAIEGLTTAPAG